MDVDREREVEVVLEDEERGRRTIVLGNSGVAISIDCSPWWTAGSTV